MQETSSGGDPRSSGAAESSANVVKGHVRSIKLAVESASGAEVPADHDLLTWVSNATSMHRRFSVGRDGKSAYERNVGKCVGSPWHTSVTECGGCLCSRFGQARYLGPMDGSDTVLVGTASGGVVKARTIKRLPSSERWTGSLLDQRTGRRWWQSRDQKACVTTTCGNSSTSYGARISATATSTIAPN